MKQDILELTKEAHSLLASSEICAGAAAQGAELLKKLESQEIVVSVIGQFKRGKSTLVNAILGEKLLPVGIVPVTSVVTRVLYGEKASSVYFENGYQKWIEPEELPAYISEQENQDNRLGVASVTLYTPSDFLKKGITLVDTPGVGSVHKHNSEAAYAFVRESDAVIFMLSVDSPINEIEIDFLRNASAYAGKFYFAVNKIDTVEEEELAEYLDYCRNLLCRLMGVESVILFGISAKKEIGLTQLAERVQRDCSAQAREILQESVGRKLASLMDQAEAQVKLCRNALQLAPGRFEQLFSQMDRSIEEAREEALEGILAAEEETVALTSQWKPGDSLPVTELVRLQKDLTLGQNGLKRFLSELVGGLFGMEYPCQIRELSSEQIAGPFEGAKTPGEGARMLAETFSKEAESLCGQLRDTMNRVLMYKEQNAYTVARRLEDLNQMMKQLRQLRKML